jgi:hypothetical protein
MVRGWVSNINISWLWNGEDLVPIVECIWIGKLKVARFPKFKEFIYIYIATSALRWTYYYF